MRVLVAVPALCLCLMLTGCVTMTPEQQHAADQNKCASYGYQPGTDKFADCMMATSNRREDAQTAQQNQRDYQRQQSIQRNGDASFPVCSAAMPNASLDTVNNKWFGPGCREE